MEAALAEAAAAIGSSTELRQAGAKLLAAADEMLKTVMNAVNNGLSRKIAETNDLKVRPFFYRTTLDLPTARYCAVFVRPSVCLSQAGCLSHWQG